MATENLSLSRGAINEGMKDEFPEKPPKDTFEAESYYSKPLSRSLRRKPVFISLPKIKEQEPKWLIEIIKEAELDDFIVQLGFLFGA